MDNVGSAVSAVQLSQKLSLPYSLINGSNLRDDVLDQRPIPCSFLGLLLGHTLWPLWGLSPWSEVRAALLSGRDSVWS